MRWIANPETYWNTNVKLINSNNLGVNSMINLITNSIIQVILFSIIPFIWWIITARNKESFFSFVGLYQIPNKQRKRIILIPLATVILFIIGEFAILCRGELEAASSAYAGMGAKAIPFILVYSFIQTSLSEEILFRGFLLKRLSKQFNYKNATGITAVIFGLVHLILIWNDATNLQKTVIALYPMLASIILSWLNEKIFNGSILPSWIVHGTLNTIEALLEAFR